MVRPSNFKSGRFFLRKHRRWPHSPYKARWHLLFNQQQAMRNLKQAASSLQQNPNQAPNLLSSLIHSFNIYNSEPTPQAFHFLIKTLSETAQLHQIPLVLDHLQKTENFETPEFILACLIKIYGNAHEIQKAIELFHTIPKFRCVPSVYLLNALLSVLCRTSEGIKRVPEILLRSRVMGIRAEESSFRLLIAALCKMKKVGYAVEMFNCMINDGFDIDPRICSLLLSSVCDQADVSTIEVMGFLAQLRKMGFCPGMFDYTNVIRFLVRGGMGKDALDVLNQMKSDGIKPDIVCYTMVLSGVIANGFYSEADNLFDELLVYGLVPDVYTYNVYIHGLCKQRNIDAGIKLIASMEELGCKPNLITYNILLEGLSSGGEINIARDLVKEMGKKGIAPSMHTYRVMIDGLTCDGKITEACALLEEAIDRGLCPQRITFDKIICGLCEIGSICKALELLEKMVIMNVSPGVRVWEALLHSSKSYINFAEDMFTGLVDSKTKPSMLQKPSST